MCVSRASSLGVGAGCIHASLSPEGEGRFVQTETAALVRMAAAPQRRVQKHCKRREGCPPLSRGGTPEGNGVVVCGCGCVCVLCVLFQHSLWYHGIICSPCRSVELIPILMSPFFIFCLHRLHTVKFVFVSSAWTFSMLVELFSGFPMWTCTYCGLWCNQLVGVVVAAAMDWYRPHMRLTCSRKNK